MGYPNSSNFVKGSLLMKHCISCLIYYFQICVIFIQICTSQRLHIPPHSTGAGACDQFNLVQSNIVLCMVLLQHQWKKRLTSDYLLLMLRTWQDTYFLVEIQKKHEELTKKEESRAKVDEKLSSFFAVHLQKGISIVNFLFLFFQTNPLLKRTGQVWCVGFFPCWHAQQ